MRRYVSHAGLSRICGDDGISRTTVVKYANMEDLSPRPCGPAGSRSRVARYADVIEEWLLDDLRMPARSVMPPSGWGMGGWWRNAAMRTCIQACSGGASVGVRGMAPRGLMFDNATGVGAQR